MTLCGCTRYKGHRWGLGRADGGGEGASPVLAVRKRSAHTRGSVPWAAGSALVPLTLWNSCVGSVNGDVRFFDPRMPEPVKVLQIVKGLTALDIHPQANLFAW